MTARTIRPGIYLEDNPPTKHQFRKGRRATPRPVVVLHTAESGTSILPNPDPKAENVARYETTRTTFGSYHLVGDLDSIIQLVRFDNEAFHDGTGSNRWSIGISLAMDAGDWATLPAATVSALVDTMVEMAVMAARWLDDNGHGTPAARRLATKAESEAPGASGFIAHGDRDPERRSDPGPGFPWRMFLGRYASAVTAERATRTAPLPTGPAPVTNTTPMTGQLPTTSNDYVAELQQTLGDLTIDGDYGPKTHARVMAVISHDVLLTTEANELRRRVDELEAALADAGDSGIYAADYDAVRAERDRLDTELEQAKKTATADRAAIARLEAERDRLTIANVAATDDLAQARARAARAEAQLAAQTIDDDLTDTEARRITTDAHRWQQYVQFQRLNDWLVNQADATVVVPN